MALSNILETIRAEAEEAASALVASAEAEAEEITTRARAEAEGEERRLAHGLDDKARSERSRIISRAHLQAARERRAAREHVYDVAHTGLLRRIGELRSSPEYEDVLASLLEEAVAVLPEASTVWVDPADLEFTERILAGKGMRLRVETVDATLGGLMLTADGRAVDNRLATRVERADEHLRFIAGELIPALRASV